ncbi:hypothetical protein JMUB7516_27540 [Staphylococcus aureus]
MQRSLVGSEMCIRDSTYMDLGFVVLNFDTVETKVDLNAD